MNTQSASLITRPIREEKTCDIPHCENKNIETSSFCHDNITCWTCHKFHCNECTKQIWSGEWNGIVFYKPEIIIEGLKHEVFQCAFCRASFDRMNETG